MLQIGINTNSSIEDSRLRYLSNGWFRRNRSVSKNPLRLVSRCKHYRGAYMRIYYRIKYVLIDCLTISLLQGNFKALFPSWEDKKIVTYLFLWYLIAYLALPWPIWKGDKTTLNIDLTAQNTHPIKSMRIIWETLNLILPKIF